MPDTEAANHGTTPPPAISGGSGGSAEAEPPGGPRPTYLCGVTITSATTAQVSSPSSSWPCGPDWELLPFELTEYARLYKLQNEMHVAAQEEEEDTEEEMDEEERAFREERARTLRGEAPTMTLQEFSDLDQRVFARVSARAAQPAPLSRLEELGDEIRVEGARVRALEFKAKEAFLARSGLSGQALEAEEMRLMRLREGASLLRRTPATATPLGAKKAGKRAAEAARRAIALEREVWVDGECRGGRRKGEGDCRPPPFAHLDAFV